MRNIVAILRRELQAYFVSPMAYVLLMLFMFIFGWFFLGYVLGYSDASMRVSMNPQFADQLNIHDLIIRGLFSTFGVIMIFVAPLLCMRVFSDEKRSGTAELLLTAPVSTLELVVGKYLGALAFGAVLVLMTGVFPIFLRLMGAPLDVGPLLAVYVGTLLLVGAFLAVWFFSSSFTLNPVVAVFIAFVTCLFFWIVGFLADIGGGGGATSQLLKSLSITEHYEDFLKGVIDTGAVVYYLAFISFSLFLTSRVIDSARWR